MAPLPRTHSHRYFTRSKSTIRKASSSLSSPSQVSGMERSVKNQGLHAGNKRRNGKNQGLHAGNKRRNGNRNIPSLTQDIIINILLLLPAKVLYEVMRYVCKEWYGIIKDSAFISAHHQLSSTGIITQDFYHRHVAFYIQSKTAGLMETVLEFPFPAEVLGSCHGLLLLHDRANREILHVVNPVIKVIVSLPPLAQLNTTSRLAYTALSCTSSGVYKVVCFDCDGFISPEKVMVYSLGVDKAWRIIDLVGINLGLFAFNMHPPVFAGKFVYCYQTFDRVGVALDVDAETIHQFSGPEFEEIRLPSCISMERGLGLMRINAKENSWEVWEMTDLKASKWAKVLVIDEGSIIRNLPCWSSLIPFIITPISLKNEELGRRLSEAKYALACYNLQRGNILVYMVDMYHSKPASYAHVNTLISPKKC